MPPAHKTLLTEYLKALADKVMLPISIHCSASAGIAPLGAAQDRHCKWKALVAAVGPGEAEHLVIDWFDRKYPLE